MADPAQQPPRPSLRRSTAWIFASQLAQAGIQAVYFVCIARALGVDEYGLFIAIAALASTLAPFAMSGMATLAMRNVARAPQSLNDSWGNSLVVITVFGGAMWLAMATLGSFVLPTRSTAVLVGAIALADLILANVHQVTSQLYLAVGNPRRSAQLPVTLNAARMIAAGALLILVPTATASQWGLLYVASTLVAVIYGLVLAHRSFGAPTIDLARARTELSTGFMYAIGFSSMTIYNDVDKTLLARLESTSIAGAYAAGYRVVLVAMTPIFSLLQASFVEFFRHGEGGVIKTAAYARKLMPTAIGLGAIAGIALYLAAPLAPIIFGSEFSDASDVMRLLAILPVLKAAQNLTADALTGADMQVMRSVLQVIVALVNIGLNLWLIPLYSYRGAIIATIASDGLLLVLVSLALQRAVRRARASEEPLDAG